MIKLYMLSIFLIVMKNVIAQNVGISNPAPAEKLHVDSGNIKLGNAVWETAANTKLLKFGDGNFVTIGEDEGDDRLVVKAKNIIIKPSSTYNGYVGINTPYAPTSPLEIFTAFNSSTSLRGLRLTQAGGGYTGSFDGSWNIHPSTDGGIFSNYLYFDLFTVNKAFIGGFDGSYYSVSDRNYKKDIHYLNDSTLLPKLMLLKPASYFMKEDSFDIKRRWGFISQDVETIFPEVVSDTRNIKMMNYSGLIPILTKGIQEQQQQINDLQKENHDLKMRIEKLEKMIQSK